MSTDIDPFDDLDFSAFVPEGDDAAPAAARPTPPRPPVLSPEERLLRADRAAWNTAGEETSRLLLWSSRPFARASRGIADAEPRVLAGLRPMAMFAEKVLGNCRQQTLLGLATTLETDITDSAVVAADGTVDTKSLLYRISDFTADLRERGLPDPDADWQTFIADDALPALWSAMRVVLGARPTGSSSQNNGGHESSTLNYEVVSTPATGRPLSEVMACLDSRIGLAPVKSVLHEFAATEQVAQMRRAHDLPSLGQSRHMLFLGNPGTGKTMMARTVADILQACGAMPDARLVEAARADLVGEFIGTSALKTRKVADAALGGVLFIDEAYALAGNSDHQPDRFAQEAVDTLVKIMEDDRDDLVVILAGYPEPMLQLLTMNPGLASRIGIVVSFPDYSSEELVDITVMMASEAGYYFFEDALGPVETALRSAARSGRFGNARFARMLLEAAVRAHAQRLVTDREADAEISLDDLITLRFADTAAACHRLGGTQASTLE